MSGLLNSLSEKCDRKKRFVMPKFAGVGVEAGREDGVVRGLNNLFGGEGDVAVSSKLDSIINSLKVCIDGVGWVVGVIHALLVEV